MTSGRNTKIYTSTGKIIEVFVDILNSISSLSGLLSLTNLQQTLYDIINVMYNKLHTVLFVFVVILLKVYASCSFPHFRHYYYYYYMVC